MFFRRRYSTSFRTLFTPTHCIRFRGRWERFGPVCCSAFERVWFSCLPITSTARRDCLPSSHVERILISVSRSARLRPQSWCVRGFSCLLRASRRWSVCSFRRLLPWRSYEDSCIAFVLCCLFVRVNDHCVLIMPILLPSSFILFLPVNAYQRLSPISSSTFQFS